MWKWTLKMLQSQGYLKIVNIQKMSKKPTLSFKEEGPHFVYTFSFVEVKKSSLL